MLEPLTSYHSVVLRSINCDCIQVDLECIIRHCHCRYKLDNADRTQEDVSLQDASFVLSCSFKQRASLFCLNVGRLYLGACEQYR